MMFIYIVGQSRNSVTRAVRYGNNPTLKISINGAEISESGKLITDGNSVDDIVGKFRSKYGEGDVKRYYPKTDVAVEVPL